jgi:hypothetical protein
VTTTEGRAADRRTYELSSYEEGLELFRRNGWTDGHPIVLPTVSLVESWLAQLGLDGATVVGESRERNRLVTVENAVVNSIMAGCDVKLVPLVLACVRAVLSPGFQHNHLASLGGPWPFFLVNAVASKRFGLNYDQYVMGPGWHSNGTVARAVSLIFWNDLEQRVGGVQRGAYGPAWRNESIVAERPDSGWPSISDDLGFAASSSTVTAFPATDFEQILVHLLDSPEHILAPIIDSIANGRFVWGTYVIVLPPNMVGVFQAAGWTKADVTAYIAANTKRSVAGLKRRTRWAEQQAGRRPWSELLDVMPGDEEDLISLFQYEERYYDVAFRDKFLDSRDCGLLVCCSGGDSGPCAYVLIPYTETGPVPVTVEVE